MMIESCWCQGLLIFKRCPMRSSEFLFVDLAHEIPFDEILVWFQHLKKGDTFLYSLLMFLTLALFIFLANKFVSLLIRSDIYNDSD